VSGTANTVFSMNTRLTIELPDAAHQSLVQEAAARGLTVEELAAQLLQARTDSPRRSVDEIMDEVLEEFHELHQRLA
jgi:hypothetical protein